MTFLKRLNIQYAQWGEGGIAYLRWFETTGVFEHPIIEYEKAIPIVDEQLWQPALYDVPASILVKVMECMEETGDSND